MDYKKILCILFLGSLREVERPRNHGLPVDDQNLVVCDGVLGVYFDRYASIEEKGGCRILIGSLALIKDDLFSFTQRQESKNPKRGVSIFYLNGTIESP